MPRRGRIRRRRFPQTALSPRFPASTRGDGASRIRPGKRWERRCRRFLSAETKCPDGSEARRPFRSAGQRGRPRGGRRSFGPPRGGEKAPAPVHPGNPLHKLRVRSNLSPMAYGDGSFRGPAFPPRETRADLPRRESTSGPVCAPAAARQMSGCSLARHIP